MTSDEWLSGENRDAIKKNITTLENSWVTADIAFEKKEEEKVVKVDDKELIASLQSKVEQLTKENDALTNEINNIKAELFAVKESHAALHHENFELKQKILQ